MNKKNLLAAALAAGALAAAGAAHAGDHAYPSKPIRMVVGYAPGGGTDIMARLIGQRLSVELGQPVLIENKPGAGQNIAATQVARAAADGYTLFLSSSALAINGSLYNRLDYDPVKSFVPVTVFGQSPNLMVVPRSLGVNSVAEFVAYAKRTPSTSTSRRQAPVVRSTWEGSCSGRKPALRPPTSPTADRRLPSRPSWAARCNTPSSTSPRSRHS